MNIQTALAQFLIQLEADGRSVHTRLQYARHLRAFAAWLAHAGHSGDLTAIGHEDVAAFLAAPTTRATPTGGVKRATSLNSLRTSLRVAFKYWHEAGVVTQNPARLVRRAVCGTAPPRAFSDDERARLLTALAAADTDEGRRDHALFLTLLTTGIRVGSAIALDVCDLDFERGEIALRTTKGDHPEVVFMPALTAALLRTHAGGRTTGALFPVTTRHVHRRFMGWLKAAAITRRASTHSLRHTMATNLLAKTGDLALVQAALRHRSIASTLVYARVEPDRVRAAMEG